MAGYLLSSTGGGGNTTNNFSGTATTNINVTRTEQAREVDGIIYTGGWA